MHNKQQTGGPQDSNNNETISCVRTLLTEDHWFIISDIHQEMAKCYLTQTSHTTIIRILTEELEMRKVSARWVPHMLTEDNHLNQMGHD